MNGANNAARIAVLTNVAGELRDADIQEVLEQHHTRYEVRPYHVVVDHRPVGAPPIVQRVQAGFDVDLYAPLEKEQFPLFRSEQARMVVDYFEAVAQEIQVKVGERCTIDVIPYENSAVFDTHQHLQTEEMLRIRISHARGTDQPVGPSEEEALVAIQEVLKNLEIQEA